MKRRYGLLFFVILLLCGCKSVKQEDYVSITNSLSRPISRDNTYRTGYKYYVPSSLNVQEYSLYNEVLESDIATFYLYVDIISYYHKVENNYQKNNNAIYSSNIKVGDKFGYLEINLQENNEYLIEIMFNYAKIEVMVGYDDINLALTQACSILRSIEYNDNVIANILGDDVLNYKEEIYNIFNTTSSDSNYLKYQEEDELLEQEQENAIKDTDLIN